MRRPVRRFCFSLAEKLGMTLNQLMDNISSKELAEWMAYYTTQDEDWIKKYNATSWADGLSPEEQMEYMFRVMKG